MKKTRRMIITAILLLLTGCGPLVDLSKHLVQMPDEVRPYYKDYIQIVGSRREAIGKIVLEPLTRVHGFREDTEYGTCYTIGAHYTIQIDPDFWANATDEARRAVLYHELTHCLFIATEHADNPHSYMFFGYLPLDIPKDELDAQVRDFVFKFLRRS